MQMREGFKTRFSRIKQVRVTRAQFLLFTRGAAVVMLIILSIKTVALVFEINGDFNTYIVPRTVTRTQSERLREYLSKHDASAVSIRVVQHDQEAMEYAGQLFNAFRQTNWDINPPNHGGPESQHLPTLQNRPSPSDIGNDGKPLYKNMDEYMQAYQAWLDIEMSNKIAEQNFDAIGLCIEVEMPGQPVNPDPRHPTPETVLQDAMRYAGIEVNCSGGGYNRDKYILYVLIGHRPRVIGDQEPTFRKIGRWIERLGDK